MPGPRDRVIVSCAVTGAIHVPSMTPHLSQNVRILRELSLEPATPDGARAMLALKGAAATKLSA